MFYELQMLTIPVINRTVCFKSSAEQLLANLTIEQISKMKTLFETSSAYEYEFLGKKVKHSGIIRLKALFDAMNALGMTKPIEPGALCMAFIGWLNSDSCSREIKRKPYYIEPAAVYIDKPNGNHELYKVYNSMTASTEQLVWVELPSGKKALIEAKAICSNDDIARDRGKVFMDNCSEDEWCKAYTDFWNLWGRIINKNLRDEIINAAKLYGVSEDRLYFFPYMD